ncbi:MAG: C4-dicarboxylate ABC transporter substrate-binding protein, partial [Pseudomonadota bacterium]
MKMIAILAVTTAFAVPAAMAQDREGWPESFTVATASQGGTYFA